MRSALVRPVFISCSEGKANAAARVFVFSRVSRLVASGNGVYTSSNTNKLKLLLIIID